MFKLVKCECDFIYLNPRPDSNEISKYYNKEYIPHLIESKSYFDIYFYRGFGISVMTHISYDFILVSLPLIYNT